MNSPHDQAWKVFWARNQSGGSDSGCLPAAWERIVAAQLPAWQQFASTLPPNARVLDLATGDGRVMRWLLGKRRDLKLTGVDLAPQLPAAPKGTKIHTGIRMEALPFGDGWFTAATSQFGFEYSDVPKAAAELVRVLRPGAVIGIMTHRIDGPILAHNVKRKQQIEWALNDQSLIAIAKQSLAMRDRGLPLSSPKLVEAPAEGARLFGPASAAWEIAEAIRRTMVLGSGHPSAHVAQTLNMIADQAANELGRIASLQAACETTSDDRAFQSALEQGGLAQESCIDICESTTNVPFAHFRTLKHL